MSILLRLIDVDVTALGDHKKNLTFLVQQCFFFHWLHGRPINCKNTPLNRHIKQLPKGSFIKGQFDSERDSTLHKLIQRPREERREKQVIFSSQHKILGEVTNRVRKWIYYT